jgi:nitrate/nitrite transport system substrate-binding protein
MTIPVDMIAVAQEVYRPALYRQAAQTMGLEAPSVDMKQEGVPASPQRGTKVQIGSSKFFDDSTFDPTRPMSYLEGFEIHSLRRPPISLEPAKV